MEIRHYKRATFFCLVPILAASLASGDLINWTNPVGGDFQNASNWSPSQTPSVNDTAIFDLATAGYTVTTGQDQSVSEFLVGTDDVTLNLGTGTLNVVGAAGQRIRVADGIGDTGTLRITSGRVVTPGLGVAAIDGQAATMGLLELDGPQTLLEIIGTFNENQIGSGDSSGEVRVFNGARFLTEDDIYLGRNGGNGTVRVVGPGSSLFVGGSLAVGLLGHGELYLQEGSEAEVIGSLLVANQGENPSGIVVVEGLGSELTVGGGLAIGRMGDGDLKVQDGGRVISAAQVQVGSRNDAEGTLVIESGGVLTSSMTNSPTMTSGTIGTVDPAARGFVQITGPGSRWLQDGNFNVGSTGMAVLQIEDGGYIECLDAQVARATTASADVIVAGAGTEWVVQDRLTVGGSFSAEGGTAQVEVTNNGRISVGQLLRVWSNGTLDVAKSGSVDVGTVAVPTTSGSVNVGTSGTLTGTGTIVGDVKNMGGAVAPGASPGRLTIDGDWIQSSGELEIEIAGPAAGSEYDQLDISGTAILAGTVEISFLGNLPTLGSEVDFLRATGGISGAFEIENGINFASNNQAYLLDYQPDHVRVVVTIPGDANLDFVVDGSDFGIWNAHKFTSGGGWAAGDFNFDGVTDGSDFGIWNSNKFTSVSRPASVPEPTSAFALACLGLLRILPWRRTP